MQDRFLRYATGAGAGIASAMLFLAATRGVSLGVALAYLGPLPIMIATLGFGLDAGLIALFFASAAGAAVAQGYALAWAALVAAPAWALAAFIAKPAFYVRKPADPQAPRVYPGPGAVAVLAAAIFTAFGWTQLSLMYFATGGYEAAVSSLAAEIRGAIDASGAARALPGDMNPDQLAEAFVQFAPIALSTGATLMQLANLYLAARTVQLSQRLPRPWRDVPTGFVLPRWLAVPAAIALGLALAAPTPFDDFGLIASGALLALYTMQGLAGLHALSRRSAARPFLLAALYFACAAAAHWVLPALALLGIAESFANLRGRAAQSLKTRP